MGRNTLAKHWLTGLIVNRLRCCIFSLASQHKMLILNGLTERQGMNGWVCIYLKRLNKLSCWRHSGFGLTIMSVRIRPLVAYRPGNYWKRLNPLLITAVINGGITDVSASLIFKVTDAVIEQLIDWQSRPLDAVYPIVYLDCIVIKIRQDKQVINKAVCLALGVNMEGHCTTTVWL